MSHFLTPYDTLGYYAMCLIFKEKVENKGFAGVAELVDARDLKDF